MAGQLSQLVARGDVSPGVEFTVGDAVGGRGQLAHRARDRARADQGGQQHHQDYQGGHQAGGAQLHRRSLQNTLLGGHGLGNHLLVGDNKDKVGATLVHGPVDPQRHAPLVTHLASAETARAQVGNQALHLLTVA